MAVVSSIRPYPACPNRCRFTVRCTSGGCPSNAAVRMPASRSRTSGFADVLTTSQRVGSEPGA